MRTSSRFRPAFAMPRSIAATERLITVAVG